MASPDKPQWLERIITFGGDNLTEVAETAADVLRVLSELDATRPPERDTVRILLVGTSDDIADALRDIFSASDTAPKDPPMTE